jgi:hypothetical protein
VPTPSRPASAPFLRLQANRHAPSNFRRRQQHEERAGAHRDLHRQLYLLEENDSFFFFSRRRRRCSVGSSPFARMATVVRTMLLIRSE